MCVDGADNCLGAARWRGERGMRIKYGTRWLMD